MSRDEPVIPTVEGKGPRQELNIGYLWVGRAICIGLLAGIPAGLLVGGIGSRIAMRISALAGGAEIAGRITENGNIVGEITFGGTLGLVVFAGLFPGIFGGPLYAVFRAWLPWPTLVRGLIFGVLLLAVFGALIIDSNNADFAELGPPVLNIAMFAFLFVLFGVVTAALPHGQDPPSPQVRLPLRGGSNAVAAFALRIWRAVRRCGASRSLGALCGGGHLVPNSKAPFSSVCRLRRRHPILGTWRASHHRPGFPGQVGTGHNLLAVWRRSVNVG